MKKSLLLLGSVGLGAGIWWWLRCRAAEPTAAKLEKRAKRELRDLQKTLKKALTQVEEQLEDVWDDVYPKVKSLIS